MIFRTHTGQMVDGVKLKEALIAVADEIARNARAIRSEDHYASHVTEAQKDEFLADRLALAERVRNGSEKVGFWLWQRINEVLTGECVAFFPETSTTLG